MMRSHSAGWLVVCGTLLAGCTGGGSVSVPSIGEPKAFAAEAAGFPEAFGANEDTAVTILRQQQGETSPRWVRESDSQDVTDKVPQKLRDLDTRAIHILPDVVVVVLRYSTGMRNHGVCVFLKDAPQDRVDQAVSALKLKELDREARVYEFDLADGRVIIEHWKPLEGAS